MVGHLPLMGDAMLKILTTTALVLTAGLAQAQDVTRALTQVAGDVYRFQNNFHFGLVVFTEDGVVVGDPINAEAATWLEAEIAEMTDQPVTHLVYSHSHGDHASGGAVFADTAEVVAHKNAPEAIDGVTIETRVEDTDTMDVGGKTLEFTYLGEGHGTDLMVVIVRPENVAFVVDAMAPRRLPFRDFPGANFDEWLEQVKVIDTLDFDVLTPGHGEVGDRASVGEVIGYMEDLRAQVLAGLEAGKSVETLQEELTFPEYADWLGFDSWRVMNIAGVARSLKDSGVVQ